jgi:type-F conjugative transfer system pilin assembly protein TrbC
MERVQTTSYGLSLESSCAVTYRSKRVKKEMLIYIAAVFLLIPNVVWGQKVYIDVPGPKCHILDVEDNVIEVVGPEGQRDAPDVYKIQAEIGDNYSHAKVKYNGKPWKTVEVKAFDARDVRKAVEKSREFKLDTGKALRRDHDAAAGKAQQLYARYKDAAYQNHLANERSRIADEVFEPAMVKAGKFKTSMEKENIQPKEEGVLLPSQRIYLFISSSVPEITLRNYAADIANNASVDIVMVMRGMIGGVSPEGMQHTKQFVHDITKIDPLCTSGDCESLRTGVQIDPELFRRFEINRVPATVFVEGVERVDGQRGSEGNQENVRVGRFFKVEGDYSLAHNLGAINSSADNEQLGAVIDMLR